ncbi:MAG: hypothetical protein NT091_04640, partial [Candidatus Falkowbacteria bacterium]|nr:hypothetical protein [Candidatus Falkowbacteria bacterium]
PLMSSPVKPGENFYLNYIGHFIATGTKQLAYTIDIADELPEFKIDAATDFVTSDSNNKFSKSIVVLPEQHDYAIDAFTFQTNLKHIVNYDTTILVSIKNKGSDYWTTGKGLTKDSSQFGNDVAAYFPGFVIASSSQDTFPTINNPIKPDGIYNYYYSGRFNSVGAHDLTFKIDANDKIIETNKSNNATSTTVNVYLTEPDADVFKFLGYNLENISSSSVRFNWKTNENTTGKVVYRFKCCEFPQMEVPSDVAGTTDGKKDHSVVVSGLIPDVGYYYKVVATRGSVDYDTGMREFWTPADNTIKFTDGPTALIDSVKKNANISWSTNLIASAKLYYGLANTGQYSFVGTTTPFSHYEYTINNLDYAKYQYYIVASSTASTTITSNLNEFSLSLPIIAPKESSALPISLAPQFNRVSGNEILPISNAELFKKLKGQILLKVEDAGQAWYVCPLDANKYYLGRPEDLILCVI